MHQLGIGDALVDRVLVRERVRVEDDVAGGQEARDEVPGHGGEDALLLELGVDHVIDALGQQERSVRGDRAYRQAGELPDDAAVVADREADLMAGGVAGELPAPVRNLTRLPEDVLEKREDLMLVAGLIRAHREAHGHPA